MLFLSLSAVLDDFSRYTIARKLCATIRSDDVTATFERPSNRHAATARPGGLSPSAVERQRAELLPARLLGSPLI